MVFLKFSIFSRLSAIWLNIIPNWPTSSFDEISARAVKSPSDTFRDTSAIAYSGRNTLRVRKKLKATAMIMASMLALTM